VPRGPQARDKAGATVVRIQKPWQLHEPFLGQYSFFHLSALVYPRGEIGLRAR
jgi:hypothetical protein